MIELEHTTPFNDFSESPLGRTTSDILRATENSDFPESLETGEPPRQIIVYDRNTHIPGKRLRHPTSSWTSAQTGETRRIIIHAPHSATHLNTLVPHSTTPQQESQP